MPRKALGITVFDAAVDRMVAVYEQGHRVVVSVSSGKDSTCALEVCVIAATLTDRLPVEAVIRDEEILYPGSYEYVERIKERDDVALLHLVANQPIINVFNRQCPYWWVFDPTLPPDQWVRQPPADAVFIEDLNIEAMTTKARFPVDEERGQELHAVIGLRVQESRGRLYGLHASGGYLTRPHNRTGVIGCRPIYDWSDGDVWKAIHDQGWDYNEAYDVMHRKGISRARLRIGPPSMNSDAVHLLQEMQSAWPQWWDRVIDRLPGIQTAAKFGRRVLEPNRRPGETWEATFRRECIAQAPPWIAERAQRCLDAIESRHRRHSTAPIPEVTPCHICDGNSGSWRNMAKSMFNGDPISQRNPFLPYAEPEQFRAGAGRWNGSPG